MLFSPPVLTFDAPILKSAGGTHLAHSHLSAYKREVRECYVGGRLTTAAIKIL